MLDTDTKRRIDTARDILVGKVPDPKSQVEQITIALIYKFMDDMDAESEEMGGRRKFFAGEFARYGWAKLMQPGLGGHEMLNLYAEGITRMPENPGIPPLFRGIFKNAYLPYRDPETLKSFLKIIDEFSYDHSEHLGDAFEYLLSVLGSQGDAGQFRTPRHIIDFIVEIVDPKKNETVLDPACGTAGFLISSYKHILKANTSIHSPSGRGAGVREGDLLTPDDRERLAKNFMGYDISPDMVRLSLVNLYLHGFADPHIVEYDTLTSQDRWGEYADVILANPPFMSPKGGIKPHNRFSVQSKRSEVLFVDYMAEHLTPKGRAGIIVPEGIIFQSQKAYKQLRKKLIDNGLVVVVSLPAGVFQPYSGVKTSILILDNSLAKKSSTIAFFKITNDGYNLGAQRRPIDKNDLPQARAEITEHLRRLRARESVEPFPSVRGQGEGFQPALGLVVPKEKIAAAGDYNLSGERYRGNGTRLSHFPVVPLGDVAQVIAGQSPPGDSYNESGTGTPFYQGKTAFREISIGLPTKWTTDPQRFAESGDILMSVRAPVGPVNLAVQRICIGRGLAAIRPIEARLLSSYAFYVLRSMESEVTGDAGATFASISRGDIEKIQIPLPPLEVQKEIVAEIEGYQKVIDGARAVFDNYRPHIPIHPDWPMVELTKIIEKLESGVSVNSVSRPMAEGEIGVLKTSCVTSGTFRPEQHKTVTFNERSRVRCPVRGDSIVISRMNTEALVGASAYISKDYPQLFLPDRLWQTVISRPDVDVRFVQHVLASDPYRQRISARCGGTSGSMKNISKSKLLSLEVPLPSLATQQAIVAEIEVEQKLVAANRELIGHFEQKIQAALARVWGEAKDDPTEVARSVTSESLPA